ncbi:MAG: type II toxin-antitoxin system HicB family antitoxin [Ignavibacteria bacterium]|nr:type II toxin-antitoxin system HicB family antitoxin [Ignavibacteria bacterium]
MLEYKGYKGKVEYIEDANILHGEVVGTRDVITFQASNVRELQRAFHDSVDDYLAFCEERGETPDKPYSGKFVVRVPEAVHRTLAEYASTEGQSINTVILEAVLDYLPKKLSDGLVHEP